MRAHRALFGGHHPTLQRGPGRRRQDQLRRRPRGARQGDGLPGGEDTMSFTVPLLLRGQVIDEATVEFGGRRGGVSFRAPDLSKHLNDLTLSAPSKMGDLYTITLEEIFDFLAK